MEAIMALRDLITWGREQPSVPSRRGEEVSPFLTLHREMNRLFDDVFNNFGNTPSLLGRMPAWSSIEVVQSEKDVRISAELPGLDEKDVEVLVDDDVLTIRGEKKSETQDQERRVSERYYGRFERVIPLPWARSGSGSRRRGGPWRTTSMAAPGPWSPSSWRWSPASTTTGRSSPRPWPIQ